MGFKVDNTADINEGIKEVPKGLERLNTGKVRSPTNGGSLLLLLLSLQHSYKSVFKVFYPAHAIT